MDRFYVDDRRHDAASQIIEENHVTLAEDGMEFNPVVQRYAWPAELDLMARIAGLHRRERWRRWNEEPFSSANDNCISVYDR